MKLFVYHDAGYDQQDIHAIVNLKTNSQSLCSSPNLKQFTYGELYDKRDYLDTTRPFCTDCKRILKKDYNINMKQLAINQKLGIKC